MLNGEQAQPDGVLCPSVWFKQTNDSGWPGSRNPLLVFFVFSSRRRHTRCSRDWSSDVCSSDLGGPSRPSRSSKWDHGIRKGRTMADRLIVAPCAWKHKETGRLDECFRCATRLSDRSRCRPLRDGLPHARRRSNRERRSAYPSAHSGAVLPTVHILRERRRRFLRQLHTGRCSHSWSLLQGPRPANPPH